LGRPLALQSMCSADGGAYGRPGLGSSVNQQYPDLGWAHISGRRMIIPIGSCRPELRETRHGKRSGCRYSVPGKTLADAHRQVISGNGLTEWVDGVVIPHVQRVQLTLRLGRREPASPWYGGAGPPPSRHMTLQRSGGRITSTYRGTGRITWPPRPGAQLQRGEQRMRSLARASEGRG